MIMLIFEVIFGFLKCKCIYGVKRGVGFYLDCEYFFYYICFFYEFDVDIYVVIVFLMYFVENVIWGFDDFLDIIYFCFCNDCVCWFFCFYIVL